jgi:hypothetical protein
VRRVSLAFLFLASVSMSAQNSAVGTLTLSPRAANGPLSASRIAVATAYVPNSSLCLTYDHYLHEIPLSKNEDSYIQEISGVKKPAPPKNIQEKIALGRK